MPPAALPLALRQPGIARVARVARIARIAYRPHAAGRPVPGLLTAQHRPHAAGRCGVVPHRDKEEFFSSQEAS